ncbi:hypothetical protein HOLleu_02502 [Holothuria leucospilota]|uniref:Uncharacterized protein n=1 Tax=Holothuria leucospilota TaxID=206669 RepID=A0A9Q1CRD9_HOLLE|nr:hypothetical protein HOLleu_02502 [Holothuria leucospilota]
MCTPLDTVLLPNKNLSRETTSQLEPILQGLEHFRNIAKANIEIAQRRQKAQYDKKAKDPSYLPGQRVRLYYSKVPVGQNAKLWQKWVGPYYISQLGPNYTMKLRRCSDNKAIKSLVHANRLKPYYDPKDRPLFPPEDLHDYAVDLDGDEILDSAPPTPSSGLSSSGPSLQ